MAAKKSLGVFFGSNSLSVIEIEKQKLLHYFEAPHNLFADGELSGGQNIPDEVKLSATIQKSLRDNNIQLKDINLSLPTSDIILRSFMIPWMTSSEIRGVVDFEVKRYIPFKLDELVYNYHSLTISEKKSKRIHILFVAIRKEILEKYRKILEQAGLNIAFIEPAPISLMRLLALKRQLPTKQRIAIVQTDKKEGSIIIVDRGIPQFVRDFRLMIPTATVNMDPESFRARLFNEIRISLDYYSRQHDQSQVNKILLISTHDTTDLAKNFSQELGIGVSSLSCKQILNLESEVPLEALNAFGIGLREAVSIPVNIDLSHPLKKPSEPKKPFLEQPENYKITLKFAITSGIIIGLTFFIFNRQVAGYEKKLLALSRQSGVYESLSINGLKKKREEIINKIAAYKQVRIKSDVSSSLSQIPKLLPKGVWLTNFIINYTDVFPKSKTKRSKAKKFPKPITKIKLDLEGYTYTKDMNQQINIVNNLIANLQDDEILRRLFDNIELVTAKKQEVNEYTVTYFKVICQ